MSQKVQGSHGFFLDREIVFFTDRLHVFFQLALFSWNLPPS